MKILFKYDEDKDIDCLLSKGAGSINQPGSKTKTYLALEAFTSDVNDRIKVREFVRKYILDNKIQLEVLCISMQKNWDKVGVSFEKRAEKIFGVQISDTITSYLTITGRFPYNTKHRFFYVSTNTTNINSTAMHELWHFYTWEKFGEREMMRLGMNKYNDVKEALTILLNLECSDLMNANDFGYPQHQALRKVIADTWLKTKNIEDAWDAACNAIIEKVSI